MADDGKTMARRMVEEMDRMMDAVKAESVRMTKENAGSIEVRIALATGHLTALVFAAESLMRALPADNSEAAVTKARMMLEECLSLPEPARVVHVGPAAFARMMEIAQAEEQSEGEDRPETSPLN